MYTGECLLSRKVARGQALEATLEMWTDKIWSRHKDKPLPFEDEAGRVLAIVFEKLEEFDGWVGVALDNEPDVAQFAVNAAVGMVDWGAFISMPAADV